MKTIVFAIAIFLMLAFVSGVGASSCKCETRANERCATSEFQERCRKRFLQRCSRRCEKVQQILRGCNCKKVASEACGTGSSCEDVKCRNAEMTSCFRNCELRLEGVPSSAVKHFLEPVERRTVKVPKTASPKKLNRTAKKEAVKNCGQGAQNKACRQEVRQQVADREVHFRRDALKACKCRSGAAAWCNKTKGRCFRRRLNRCRSRCLRRACRVRSESTCASRNSKGFRSCVRRSARACRKLHLNRRRVSPVKRAVQQKRLYKIAKREAVKKCGRGAQNRICRQQAIDQVFDREDQFRRDALKACKCRSTAAARCNNKTSGRCFKRRLSLCRRQCFRKACVSRARNECSSRSSGMKRCLRRRTSSCRRLHLNRRRVVRKSTVVVVRRTLNSRRVKVVFRSSVFRQCGKGSQNKECRQDMIAKIVHREAAWRRDVLKACKCRSAAAARCNNKTSGRCFKTRVSRCRRQCLRRACRSRAQTDCAARKSGVKGCIRRTIRRCRRVHLGRRVVVKKSTTTKTVTRTTTRNAKKNSSRTVTKKVQKQRLHRTTKKEAVKKCGRGSENKTCRQEVRQQISDREVHFRRDALKACKCRSTAAARCNNKTSGRCFKRRLNRCRRQCLRRACRSRAQSDCAARKSGVKGCVRRSTRACRKLHLGRRSARRVKTVKIIRRAINQKTVRKAAKKEAVKKCGKGAQHRACRKQVIEKVVHREAAWRRDVLKACKCRSAAAARCNNKTSGRCFKRRLSRCRRQCLRRACRNRARIECSPRKSGAKGCVRRSTRACRRVHLGRRRATRVVRQTSTRAVKTTRTATRKVTRTTPSLHKKNSNQKRDHKRAVESTQRVRVVKVKKQLEQKKLHRHARAVALKSCGTDANAPQCRKRFLKLSIEKELHFRSQALKACKCRSTAASKCDNQTSGACFSRRLHACRTACLTRACETRAHSECKAQSADKTQCAQKASRNCKRLHLAQYKQLDVAFIYVEKRLDEQKLRAHAVKVARHRCGPGLVNRACRRQVRRELIRNELTFRLLTLQSCKCKSAAEAKCSRRAGKCFHQAVSDCRRRCLNRACKARAQGECAQMLSAEGRKACEKEQVIRCGALHLGRTGVRIRSSEVLLIIHQQVDEVQLRKRSKVVAWKKCGEERKCRRKVEAYSFDKEVKFRATALRACGCKSQAAAKCAAKRTGRCFRMSLYRCRRACLLGACKKRAASECESKEDGQKGCQTRRTRRCRKLHLGEFKEFTAMFYYVAHSLDERKVKAVAQIISEKRCGKGKAQRACRKKVVEEVMVKELGFRLVSLRACKCRSHAAAKCQGKRDGQCYRREVSGCRKACLKAACKRRAGSECSKKSASAKCVERVTDNCGRLHYGRKGIRVWTLEALLVVHERIDEVRLRANAKWVAAKRCGAGKEGKACRRHARTVFVDAEVEFRSMALRGCKCRSQAAAKCDGKRAGACYRKHATACRSQCLRNACQQRAVMECESREKHTAKQCVSKRARRCRRLHAEITKKIAVLKAESRKEAVEICGKSAQKKGCRRKFSQQIFSIEFSWRRNASLACGCREVAEKRCKGKNDATCFKREANKCKSACFKEACGVRAQEECSILTFPNKSCIRKRTNRCTRLHA